jgi:hypothetical protein
MIGSRWSGRLVALLGAVAAGAAGCAVSDPAPTRPLTGVAVLEDAAALPHEAELVVQFRGDDGSGPVEERAMALGRQPPLHFQLRVPEGRSGRLDVAIDVAGEAGWTAEPLAVPGLGGPVDLGEVTLARAAPAALTPDRPQGQATAPWTPAAAAEPAAQSGMLVGAAAAQVPQPPGQAAETAAEAAAEEGAATAAATAADTVPERLSCGGTEIRVARGAGSARLTVGAVDVDLVAVGGGRYEVPGDPETFFAAGQDAPVVSLAGERLPPCDVIR